MTRKALVGSKRPGGAGQRTDNEKDNNGWPAVSAHSSHPNAVKITMYITTNKPI
jgi:hypothetical protein